MEKFMMLRFCGLDKVFISFIAINIFLNTEFIICWYLFLLAYYIRMWMKICITQWALLLAMLIAKLWSMIISVLIFIAFIFVDIIEKFGMIEFSCWWIAIISRIVAWVNEWFVGISSCIILAEFISKFISSIYKWFFICLIGF